MIFTLSRTMQMVQFKSSNFESIFLMLKNVMCGDVLHSNIFYVVSNIHHVAENYANAIRRGEEWSGEQQKVEMNMRDKGAAAIHRCYKMFDSQKKRRSRMKCVFMQISLVRCFS